MPEGTPQKIASPTLPELNQGLYTSAEMLYCRVQQMVAWLIFNNVAYCHFSNLCSLNCEGLMDAS